MSLPEITTPIYDVVIPSSGKTVRIRPFLVKEEKLLLIATQSGETKDIITTVTQIINNCFIDRDMDVSQLTFFDVDYLFITLRAKSISDTMELEFSCNAVSPDTNEKCRHVFQVDVDMAKAKIVKNEEIEDKVWITETIGVKFKYPKYSTMRASADIEDDLERKMSMIYSCIEYVFDKDKVYSDYSREDFNKFSENLTVSQIEKLEKWVDNLPTFRIDIEKTCDKCGFDHKIKYDDFNSFFL